MICPYRKETQLFETAKKEIFMPCHGEECPFYAPKGSFNANKAFCKRAEAELSGTKLNYF